MKTKNAELIPPKNKGGGWAVFIEGKPNIIKATKEVAVEYIFNELTKMAREKRSEADRMIAEAWRWNGKGLNEN